MDRDFDEAMPGAPGGDEDLDGVTMTATRSCPATVPEKFWDPEAGEVRVDALAKSYTELERKLGAMARDVPEGPDGYVFEDGDGLIVPPDPDVNGRLHKAGFSRDQARVVYELAGEYLPQMVSDMACEFEAQRQVDRLVSHYGGSDRWGQTAKQLSAWGREHLPPEVFEALATTREGILAMERMMASGEPALIAGSGEGSGGLSETDLKEMMRDPRYWRERDPATVRKVRDGFRRLFPEKG